MQPDDCAFSVIELFDEFAIMISLTEIVYFNKFCCSLKNVPERLTKQRNTERLKKILATKRRYFCRSCIGVSDGTNSLSERMRSVAMP